MYMNTIIIRGPICAGKSTLCKELRELIPNSSLVTSDRIKRAIDNRETSEWRDEIAFKTSVFLAKLLMKKERTLIIDIHSSRMDYFDKFKKLCTNRSYPVYSFLLEPSLKTCIERNRKRAIPEVHYIISDKEVELYWNSTKKIEGEEIFDTSRKSSKEIAREIVKCIGIKARRH